MPGCVRGFGRRHRSSVGHAANPCPGSLSRPGSHRRGPCSPDSSPRLLDQYPGADGVKIGYTDAALKTIVASVTHDGHRIYVSLMRSQDLVGDSTKLFDWVWSTFAW